MTYPPKKDCVRLLLDLVVGGRGIKMKTFDYSAVIKFKGHFQPGALLR